MTRPFTRQLGYESGVQLNPTQDNSERTAAGLADQVFAVAMRCTRGAIDAPFKVNASNYLRKVGYGEAMKKNALNEAHVQVFEALTNGAYEAVVKRLITPNAVLKYVIATLTADGTGINYSVAPTVPTSPFLFAFKHLECFNDGVRVAVHAEVAKNETGGLVANPRFSVKLIDPQTGANVLPTLTGSSDPDALDDYGVSDYLPDVVASRTDDLLFVVPHGASIPVNNAAYGFDVNGFENWATTVKPVLYFDEGGTGYGTQDYYAARTALVASQYDYGRIVSAGSQSPALLLQLSKLAFEVNKPLDYDVVGTLTPEEVELFANSLAFDSHYCNGFWSPNVTDDPLGLNPRGYFGLSAFHTAQTCLRNANKNEFGFAPKQYPIAGKNFPITRSRIKQTQTPTPQQYSVLAKLGINPVVYEVYSGGGKTVFKDSLTSIKKSSSFLRLQSVVDRVVDIEERLSWLAKDALQMPMDEAIRIAERGTKAVMEGACASKWLQPSKDLGGLWFSYKIVPSEEHPEDEMVFQVDGCFTGTNRRTFITFSVQRPN